MSASGDPLGDGPTDGDAVGSTDGDGLGAPDGPTDPEGDGTTDGDGPTVGDGVDVVPPEQARRTRGTANSRAVRYGICMSPRRSEMGSVPNPSRGCTLAPTTPTGEDFLDLFQMRN